MTYHRLPTQYGEKASRIDGTIMTRPLSPRLIIGCTLILMAFGFASCAANNYRRTIAQHGAISDALIAVQKAELQAFASQAYDAARHQRYEDTIKTLITQRGRLNDALAGWAAGQPMPPALSQAVDRLHGILTDAATLNPPPGLLLSSIEQALGLLTINPA